MQHYRLDTADPPFIVIPPYVISWQSYTRLEKFYLMVLCCPYDDTLVNSILREVRPNFFGKILQTETLRV